MMPNLKRILTILQTLDLMNDQNDPLLLDHEVEVIEHTGRASPDRGAANFDERHFRCHTRLGSTAAGPVLCSGQRRSERRLLMPKGLIFLLVMIAVIVVYTIAKIINYNRLSEQQWKEVDKRTRANSRSGTTRIRGDRDDKRASFRLH